MTDLGPSVGYVIASLALCRACAGSTWSLDAKLRPALGRLSWPGLPPRRPGPADLTARWAPSDARGSGAPSRRLTGARTARPADCGPFHIGMSG